MAARKCVWLLGLAAVAAFAGAVRAEGPGRFVFGGSAPAGWTAVGAETRYSEEAGFGIEGNIHVPAPGVPPMPTTAPAMLGGKEGIASERPFVFSVKVPEGNYRVTVTLGDGEGESTTSVKTEARRLMVEGVHTGKGEMVTRRFGVNVRRPEIAGGGSVKLDPREPGSFTWDGKLSLEFCGVRPAVSRVEVERDEGMVTVFLCGDSTVTDQPREPYGTWGQMLPRFLGEGAAVANYAESGETVKAFRMEKRWEKVMSVVKAGDYVFLQFGHNDLNQRGRNAMWPADDPSGDWSKTYSEANGDYKELLKEYAAEVKGTGAVPVIVSPMTKIDIRSGELNVAGLREYPKAAVEAAKEAGVACIDLNGMSADVMKALGPQGARKAYVDGLHTNSYGGYLLARCVLEGIREQKLGLAKLIGADAGMFDVQQPEPAADKFKVPLEDAPVMRFGRGRGTTAPAATRAN